MGIDNHGIGEGGGGLDPPPMLGVLSGQRVLRIFDRDQIMDQADKAGSSPSLQTGNGAALFKMMVRNEEVNW